MTQSNRQTIWATGAYGRQPTIADWNRGKDFRAVPPVAEGWVGGPYFSKRDCAELAKFADTIVFLMGDGPVEWQVPLVQYHEPQGDAS